MSAHLDKLNRLRVNAGKKPLKSWKTSKDSLLDAIDVLVKEGHLDTLPGANVAAAPVTTDPEVAAALEKPAPEVQHIKPGLGRGLGDEKYAVHSRKAVQDHRRDEKKANKADKAEKKELAKGEVDPKKDPEKAARQKKHIEEKQAARAAKNKANGKNPANGRLKAPGKDETTVAEIARELGIDPKIARAKLRRHEDKLTKLHTRGQDRWTFPKSAAKEIKAILK